MTTWWNKNAETRKDDFQGWVGDHDQETKLYCRKYVEKKKYKSIIDCGCGLATDYYGYKLDNHTIDYTGMDSCKFFVETNKSNGISMIEAELEANLPVADKKFDCVYCRGVIEHLSYYEKTLNEFIRIAKKEVLIGWFIKPDAEEDKINYWPEEDLYHNKYNKEKLEQFLLTNSRIVSFFWKEISNKENVLHIKVK